MTHSFLPNKSSQTDVMPSNNLYPSSITLAQFSIIIILLYLHTQLNLHNSPLIHTLYIIHNTKENYFTYNKYEKSL